MIVKLVEKRASDKTRCTKKNISKESIEAAVMQIVSDFIWDEEMIQQYISMAESMDSKVTVNPRVAELEKVIRNHKERVCRADDAYMDTGDKKWIELSKQESEIIKEYESELKEIDSITKHSKSAKDFIEEIKTLRDLWIEMQTTAEGRSNIIKSYVSRIDVFDPEPNDPDKYKLRISIKTDTDSEYFTEIEAKANMLSRNQNTNVHQTHITRTYFKSEIRSGYLFLFKDLIIIIRPVTLLQLFPLLQFAVTGIFYCPYFGTLLVLYYIMEDWKGSDFSEKFKRICP